MDEKGMNCREMKREVLKTLVLLSVPTMIEQILSTLFQYVDTAMVGRLGERATAAVSVTTTVTWLVNSMASALGVAVLAMISKAVGSRDGSLIRRITGHVVLAVVVCGLVMTVASVAFSPWIPRWMGAEKDVQGEASRYFLIISLPLLFRAASTIFGAAIRATQDTKTPMFISMGCNFSNVLLNGILIYGLRLGVTGAALGSAVSYTLSGILMFRAFCRKDSLRFPWREFRVDGRILREGFSLSLPVLGTSLVSCLGYVFFAGMVSGMGTSIFAAHSIAVTAETVFYIPGYGLRTATSALVGASLGEGNRERFQCISQISVILTVAMMCVSGAVLYFAALPLMQLFTNSAKVAVLGASMLRMVAFSEPFFGLMVVVEGIFYGLGRTRYAFFVESFSMWGIRILATFVCVELCHLDLRAVWYCMIGDNICKAILFTAPALTRRWRERLFEGAMRPDA